MREEAVNVPESAVVAAAPTSSERAKNVNGGNGDKRQNPTHSRHATKCRICNHPDRHAIEFEFLNWRNPADLARSYKLRDLTTIYRHAHATSLFAKRRLNLRFAMERIVERVNEVPVTATSVIRAARAISRINDAGEWVDPPSRVIVTHIHAEDSSFVGASRGTGSQPVDSSVEVSSEDLQARAGTQGFVGRGFNRDKKRRSSKPSTRARQGGEGSVPSIPAHDSSRRISRPSLIFDDALLDEPSDSASAELPRIDGKPAPPEVILQLTPEFARCREERRRALEADRQASAASASSSGGFTPTASSQTENVPLFSSLLPQAAPDKPATAKQSPRAAGPPLGSSGSANPPFPFTPEPLRRWKPRRRF